ncbi:MAG: hypothetical protein M3336_06020, partial [Chloroflexota bacterium]|nr:hypothetical protein [Chloroflexota bacterium]
PGLVDLPAWPELRASALALLAVCGQARLLEQPFEPTAAMLQARERWRAGVVSELDSACHYLAAASVRLAKPAAC